VSSEADTRRQKAENEAQGATVNAGGDPGAGTDA
jgi:hypothetical protein